MKTEVIERLKSLEDRKGVLTPDAVLQDAEDPESPLHKHFQWDDSKAAREYRLDQARELIRSVRLVIKTEKHQVQVIGYVRNPSAEPKEQGYIETARLRTDKERAREALTNELKRAENALQRAYDVAESLGLQGEVELILAQIRNTMNAA